MKDSAITQVLAGARSAGRVTPHIRSFAEDLLARGYTTLTAHGYVQSAAHLGCWMEGRDLDVHDLTDAVVQQFARHQCRCPGLGGGRRRPSRRFVARVRRFVRHLGLHGVAPRSAAPERTELQAVFGFREWLQRHRGLASWTIRRYEALATKLLATLGDDPAFYDAALVRCAFLAHVQGVSRAYAKCFGSALRALLRFLAAEGRCRPDLDRAVPTIPEWRLSALPRYLPAADVERVIAACDRDTPCGVRDRAVLLLLARLGLRASDIVMLTLADLDWTAGTVRVRAKSRRDVRLPLPQEVGDAILDYLTRMRPVTPSDRVFLCVRAPRRPFTTCATVSDIVRVALRRAGIMHPPSRGAHLLRHSAATALLRAGASLDVIATVLRHTSTDTTAHYAKVDVALLTSVAQPWPEVSDAHR